MSSCTLSPTAYALPILHAAAHPSSTVTGLLLGTSEQDISDALPLLHRYASLSPTAELGIDLARTHAAGKGQRVVGVYVACSDGGDKLGRAGDAVLAALRKECAGAVGLVVSSSTNVCRALTLQLDNGKLAAGQDAWVVAAGGGAVSVPDAAVAGTLKLVKAGVHDTVRDLDDHLDDA